MNGSATVVGVSALMFVGSYAAGALPMLWRAGSPSTLHLINAAGAGLLVGAALCVVLPEGFVTFAEAQEKLSPDNRYPEWVLGFTLLLGFLSMLGLQAAAEYWSPSEPNGTSSSASEGGQRSSPPASSSTAAAAQPPAPAARHLSSGSIHGPDASDLEHAALLAESHRSTVGPGLAALEVAGRPGRAQEALTTADQVLYGLLVHAAADGIAIGAACLSSSLALTSSVAGAILIHKFPVAFGLSSYLKGAGWYGMRLQKGLLLFCAAAPVAALVVYLALGNIAAMSDERNVALCLLFSGGTVLHAGLVHVLPSVLGNQQDEHGHSHAYSDGGAPRKQAKPRTVALAVMVASSLVPLLVSALVPEAE